MTAGRPAIPTVVKIAEGNRSRRKEDVDLSLEVQPEKCLPPPPDFLTNEAKEEWNVLAQHLHDNGLLTVLDRNALILLCQAWGRYVQATDKLQETNALVVKGYRGEAKINPYLKVVNNEMENVYKMLVQFGMTPSARVGLKNINPKQGEQDKWAEFARQARLKREGKL